MRDSEELDVQEMASKASLRASYLAHVVIGTDHEIPEESDDEEIRAARSSTPKFWCKTLQQSDGKLVDANIEWVIECFDALHAESKEVTMRKEIKIVKKTPDMRALARDCPCDPQKDAAKTKATAFCKHYSFGNRATSNCDVETGRVRGHFECKKWRKCPWSDGRRKDRRGGKRNSHATWKKDEKEKKHKGKKGKNSSCTSISSDHDSSSDESSSSYESR